MTSSSFFFFQAEQNQDQQQKQAEVLAFIIWKLHVYMHFSRINNPVINQNKLQQSKQLDTR